MRYDVVIVGGAAVGSATAYHLLLTEPSLRVAVVERDPTYRRASTMLSAGNVRVQFNLEENIRMSAYTLELLSAMPADPRWEGFDLEFGARHQGNLFLCDAAGESASRAGMALQRELGCEVEWLDAGEIERRYPHYASPTLRGGTLGTRDGSVDVAAVLRAFRRASMAMGATYVDAEVAGFVQERGAITGVDLVGGGSLPASWVAVCAGAWSPALLRSIGLDLPVEPVMRTVYVVASSMTTRCLPTAFLPTGPYVVPGVDGMWEMAWSQPDDPVGFDFVAAGRQQFVDRVWPELIAHLPAFDALRVVSSWAGVYAVNRLDGNAILGQWPGLGGMVFATGFSGHGFQHSPAMGRYLAELILERPHAIELSRLGPGRVIDGVPIYEHQGRLI